MLVQYLETTASLTLVIGNAWEVITARPSEARNPGFAAIPCVVVCSPITCPARALLSPLMPGYSENQVNGREARLRPSSAKTRD